MADATDGKSVWINYTESNPDPAKPPVRTLREVVPLGLVFGRPDGAGTGQAGGEWCVEARDVAGGATRRFALSRVERWAMRSPRPAEEGESR